MEEQEGLRTRGQGQVELEKDKGNGLDMQIVWHNLTLKPTNLNGEWTRIS